MSDIAERNHEILDAMNAGPDAMATVLARLAQLEAENAKLRQAKAKGISLKVSDKGAISVYGMGRFPITMYRGQMERLLDAKDEILAFIEANAADLSVKS